jgi:glutathione S-transferase
MILVGQYDSPFVRRVAIALNLLGMPFERDTRSVFGDAEAMRKINPLGRIPSLVLDDGEVLIDSWAILDHIDEMAGPDRALLPTRGADRRRGLRITAMAVGGVDKAGGAVYERLLRPADLQYQPWIDRVSQQARSVLMALEAETGAGWYLGSGSTDTGSTNTGSTNAGSTDTGSTDTGSTDTGSTDTGSTDTGSTDTGSTDTGSTNTGSTNAGPKTPDIMVACMVYYMQMRTPELFDAAVYPKLAALAARAEARPAFKDARPSDDETMPDHS